MKPGVLRRAVEEWTAEHCGWEERAYLGMSQIGKCPRQLFDDLVEGREVPGVRGAMLCYEGLLHEADLIGRLEAMGLYAPGRELVAAWDERFRGHTDGELVCEGEEAELLEIKSVTAAKFERVREQGRAFDEHYDQAQMYMLYGAYERGVVLYKCRESGRVWPVPVRADPERQVELERKAGSVLACVDKGWRPLCECGRH